MQAIHFGQISLSNPERFKDSEGRVEYENLSKTITKLNESPPIDALDKMGIDIHLNYESKSPRHLSATVNRKHWFFEKGTELISKMTQGSGFSTGTEATKTKSYSDGADELVKRSLTSLTEQLTQHFKETSPFALK